MGELGGVFAQGLLRNGRTVVPVLRSTSHAELASLDPELALVTVRENDLDGVLGAIDRRWRIGLVQNELRPGDWRKHDIDRPTVAVVWFEKKKGTPVRPLAPTRIAGPKAELLVAALRSLEVPAEQIDEAALDDALAVKNLYILATNLAGLAISSSITTGELARDHRAAFDRILNELFAIERALHPVGEHAIDEVYRALLFDPAHKAMGRTARERLDRTRAIAAKHGIDTPALHAIE
jgi:hypothetical protein